MTSTSSDNRSLGDQLLRLLESLEITGRALLPSSDLPLLQSIVDASARIFGAAAASIALVDAERKELEFKVSFGAGNDEIVGMKIPIDKGIAGYVAMTGQPIGISNVREDARFNKDFAESTGYVPQSILATPLLWGDRVIGVMEVLDKIRAPSFGMEEMELLGLFADQAAIAIFQAQQFRNISFAFVEGIKEILTDEADGDKAQLLAILERSSQDRESIDDVLAIADIFSAISDLGDSERKACLQILTAFRDYVLSQPGFMP